MKTCNELNESIADHMRLFELCEELVARLGHSLDEMTPRELIEMATRSLQEGKAK